MIRSLRFVLGILAVLVFVNGAYAQKPGIGTWALTTVSPEGEFKSTVVISEQDGKITAVGKSPQGERAFDSAAIDGSAVKLVVTIDYNGTPLTITYTGKITGEKMEGDADYGGLATGTWSAVAQK